MPPRSGRQSGKLDLGVSFLVGRPLYPVVGSRGPGRLYALGDLARGTFFFIFGVPFLVRRSADIARAIQDDLHEQAPRHHRSPAVTV